MRLALIHTWRCGTEIEAVCAFHPLADCWVHLSPRQAVSSHESESQSGAVVRFRIIQYTNTLHSFPLCAHTQVQMIMHYKGTRLLQMISRIREHKTLFSLDCSIQTALPLTMPFQHFLFTVFGAWVQVASVIVRSGVFLFL